MLCSFHKYLEFSLFFKYLHKIFFHGFEKFCFYPTHFPILFIFNIIIFILFTFELSWTAEEEDLF